MIRVVTFIRFVDGCLLINRVSQSKRSELVERRKELVDLGVHNANKREQQNTGHDGPGVLYRYRRQGLIQGRVKEDGKSSWPVLKGE